VPTIGVVATSTALTYTEPATKLLTEQEMKMDNMDVVDWGWFDSLFEVKFGQLFYLNGQAVPKVPAEGSSPKLGILRQCNNDSKAAEMRLKDINGGEVDRRLHKIIDFKRKKR
jgi:hypothetical protein